jgi:hypothetical protein
MFRFLESEVDFRGRHFQFIPFGAGRRICPGMQFALATIELALANLVRMFDWELPNGMMPWELDMSDTPGLVKSRRVGLRLVARPFEWDKQESNGAFSTRCKQRCSKSRVSECSLQGIYALCCIVRALALC